MKQEDPGFVRTWPDVFSRACELFKQGRMQSIAIISLNELRTGQYVATPISETSTSKEESLRQISELAEILYEGNEHFHLSLKQINCLHPDYPEGKIWMLVVVYMKPGETLE